MSKIRFGILSTANIARKNWKSIHYSGNSIVTAVASRDVKKAEQFIKELQAEAPFEKLPEALGSYEELLASPNVDAIYIPLPTGLRKEWVLRAASAGKHVVCEKPCGVSAADVQEMISTCKKNRVQFMDGVMFMHNPRMARIRKFLDDGKSIGQIKRITSNFSFHMAENVFGSNVRINSALEPAGCLGDLGWYNLRFALWAMNWKLPREVRATILSERRARKNLAPVPVDFSAELIFDDRTSVSFYCSFIAQYQNWAQISGDRGQLRVDDFVHSTGDPEPVFHLNQKEIRTKYPRNFPKDLAQATAMIRNFSNQIHSGKLNDEWPMWALKTQKVLDACLKSALKRESLNR
ncbi:MAG TPA: Gfo/Idh/MocA family oxidoreductase [Verrucomicrobiae bacterium]|nr:Gfo/Idh/MocA family oxidoreductase [Verrucomicrobiae bacterium]